MLVFGWRMQYLSLILQTGPKFFEMDFYEDFSFWSADLILGAAPIPGIERLEFILELNFMVELFRLKALGFNSYYRKYPLAISAGARYQLGPILFEVALRYGMKDSALYYGDLNVGVQVGYDLGL